ncbi:hybrid sensor histidine kinase/response regulator [Acidovorax sp. SRB_14]|uniref:hybrid sensor histidine kinase/response regulator n=1 Tax=Acidovorax sp. SRB_14 TaxID=1962699 RepID=UPI0015630BE4|nr:hybrid sensor histidine kinase/response regulator [Acidovorax sp. SRB_14]
MTYRSAEPAAPPSPRVKCLLVDDTEENLTALEAVLQRSDIEILKASCGSEALELLLQHNDVALALLDVQMPEMNGFELAELIRGSERTRHVPLIFMTAGSRDQNWQFKGYETGAVDFLYKPIDTHALVNKANIFFELHRQKRALAHELQERTESLRLNEMYMAVLSHDLRNPLTAILTGAMALQRPLADPDKLLALAQQIQSSGRRMGQMIEDLLDVARVRQAGSMPLKRGPASLDTLVGRAAQELREGGTGRRIEVAARGDLAGVWDSERMLQVASNLIGNALQHGVTGTAVQVTADGTAAHHVVLTVDNEGAIAESLMAHLFNPFRERIHQPGRHQGLGLGLYIAQQIVLAHGGTIEASSGDARTTFRVQLPRIACESDGRGGF